MFSKLIRPTAVDIDTKKVLATYSVPLGDGEAQLVFTGNELHPEDFDALVEYVAIFKKQFERKKAFNDAVKRMSEPASEAPLIPFKTNS